ncbi:hypothetical protein BLNAU_4889 [Blattamonas nauphoetae]|uniref:Uncharacterized protein n=1 Tax=Blattamonas nauphoetae TaxID=2049346 RepID=A0ABQ9Y8H5_9EUKA|nr:hypothetical protein BLNAU_4889 [Blattamonas nauphoetae]
MSNLTPTCWSDFSNDDILFKLVPTGDGTCSGFAESMVTLLTSYDDNLVNEAWEVLVRVVCNTSPKNRLAFLATGFFELLPEDFYDDDRLLRTPSELSLMKIVTLNINDLFDESAREQCEEDGVLLDFLDQTFIDQFFIPIEPFLEKVFTNRRLMDRSDLINIFPKLTETILEYSPQLDEMTHFVLSSPSFALAFFDTLESAESNDTISTLLRSVIHCVNVRWDKDPAVLKHKQQIKTKLREEGLGDEIELQLRLSERVGKHHVIGIRVRVLIEKLGGNAS